MHSANYSRKSLEQLDPPKKGKCEYRPRYVSIHSRIWRGGKRKIRKSHLSAEDRPQLGKPENYESAFIAHKRQLMARLDKFIRETGTSKILCGGAQGF
jgi:hypothetical protein